MVLPPIEHIGFVLMIYPAVLLLIAFVAFTLFPVLISVPGSFTSTLVAALLISLYLAFNFRKREKRKFEERKAEQQRRVQEECEG